MFLGGERHCNSNVSCPRIWKHNWCFVEIITTSQSINELNYFPNCDTLQARQPFGNYSVLLYLYFTVIIFLIRLLCVTYRFRTTLTKNKQRFETHGFGCVSQQNNWARAWIIRHVLIAVFATMRNYNIEPL